MIEEGEISKEESSGLSSIYQGLDCYFTAHPAEEKPRHDQASLELLPGDTLMLASDGIDVLSPEQIVAAISSDLENSTQELFEAVVQAGSDDNITILLITWVGKTN
jgi:serine/threonine protein phosphatase PrpC